MFVYARTQEKGAVTPRETDSDLPRSVQEFLAEAWVSSVCYRVRGTEYSIAYRRPLEKGMVNHFSILAVRTP